MANENLPLFGRGHREKLFQEKQFEVEESLAYNRAYTETQVLDDPNSLERRYITQRSGNVEDEVIARLHTTLLDSDPTDLLSRLREDLPREEKFNVISQEISRRDLRSATSRDVLLYKTYQAGAGNATLELFDKHAREATPAQIQAMRDQTISEQLYRGRREVDDFVATKGFKSYGDMFANVAGQDFIPVYNVASRIGLNRQILSTITTEPVEGFRNLFTGEIRQQIREHLVAMPPDEFNRTVKAIVDEVKRLERDPKWGPLLTKYNILESFEGIFTEEVLSGQSPDNFWDRFAGNLDVAVESLFTAGTLLAWGFKGIRSAARAGDNVRANQIARTTGRKDIVAEWTDALVNDALSSKFQIEAAGGIPQALPKPPSLIDDTDLLTEQGKRVVHYTESVSSDILDTTSRLTGIGITPSEKANAVRRTIENLDLTDNVQVMPRMTAVEPLEGGVGARLHVVIGESTDRGFSSLEDALEALKDLDLDQFSVVRVTENGVLGQVFSSKEELGRALTKQAYPTTARPDQPGVLPEYFIGWQQERYWHSIDKEAFGDLGGLQNTGAFPRALLPPNMRLDKGVYESFFKAYAVEQNTIAKFNVLLKPYYDLSLGDKRFVASALEWGEDFAKAHGRAPMLSEYFSKYDGITSAQIEGIIAQRKALDTMYEIANRRLYREMQTMGYRTARPIDNTMAQYHGSIQSPDTVSTAQHYLDPVTGDLVQLTRQEVTDLYNAGGAVMKLDMAVDVPTRGKGKADLILLREDAYEVGELSTRPLKYHEGYSPRFYDDPWIIVKESTDVPVNGVVRGGVRSTEAIRTAGTQREAEQWTRRANRRELGVDGRLPTEEADELLGRGPFKVVPSRNLDQVESSLLQKETLYREGRLFWDERNFDRLPSVNGSMADLEDPIRSIERSVALLSRQTAQEDLLKGYKRAFVEEYKGLEGVSVRMFDTKSLKQIKEDLEKLRRKAVGDRVLKERYSKAIEMVDYFRLMDGTESAVIPRMRELALNIATTVNNWTSGRVGGKSVQKYIQSMDPTRTMRSINFNLFMALRPGRQALLQSAQIAYLAGIKPGYVMSPKLFTDAFGLRMGLASLRKAGYQDGFSVAKRAKLMGLTQNEYRKLLKEFDRSGLVDLVDVHSFSGGARRSQRTPLPKKGEPSSYVGFMGRQVGQTVVDWAQRIGFDFGERNNLTFTYMLAVRKHLDDNKIKSLLDLSDGDWDKLALEASNLSLGMIRPNNFGYQSGLMSIPTQFMAFSHKAMLGLLGQNPSIKGTQALKIAIGSYLLFGANMFGARDWVDQQLESIGVSDANIPGTSFSLIDLLSAGLIENVMNSLAKGIDEESKDLDLGPLAPGMDFTRFWDMQLSQIAEQPWKVALGPFYNTASRVMDSFTFVDKAMRGLDTTPERKLMLATDRIARGLFPQYNDLVMSYMAYKMGHWYSASLETVPVRSAWNDIISRGLVGVRSQEEIAYYDLQRDKFESDSFYREVVDANRKFLREYINRWQDGEFTDEEVYETVALLTELMEDFPEGRRQETLTSILKEVGPEETESILLQLRRMMQSRQLGPESIHLIDRMETIPEEKRGEVKAMAQEIWELQLEHDATVKKTLEKRRDNR